jgi:hypothetical protein
MENSIHIKVSYRNDLRRFPMNGVGFSELRSLIQNLFDLKDKDFILQYRDNENDLVTLSSDEEMACAYSCISGNVLQMVVSDPLSMEMVDPRNFPFPPVPWGHFHPFHPHHGHHPHPYLSPFNRHCHFGKDQSRRCHRIGQKKEMLSRKLTEVDSALMELSGQEEQLTPLQQRRLSGLQKKKKSIEHHLAKVDDWSNRVSTVNSEKFYKKRAKHEKKFIKKIDKHRKYFLNSPFLPESTKTELMTLQTKIQSLKPELEEAKVQLKASKAALKEAQERSESTEQWVREITQLKEMKQAKKQQMVSLGLQMRNLHASVY